MGGGGTTQPPSPPADSLFIGLGGKRQNTRTRRLLADRRCRGGFLSAGDQSNSLRRGGNISGRAGRQLSLNPDTRSSEEPQEKRVQAVVRRQRQRRRRLNQANPTIIRRHESNIKVRSLINSNCLPFKVYKNLARRQGGNKL